MTTAKPVRGSERLRDQIFVMCHPRYLRRWARRLVVLLPPVGLLLWLVALIGLVVSLCVVEAGEGLVRFWGGKPRKRRRYYPRG